jgi:PPE-repeat protein
MDFGALPPEITSVRMYSGPGSGSMLTAAAAWDGLATELQSAAASYSSVIAGLIAGWQGPSSASMAAAAAPYVAWMSATAAQAKEAANQARAAAAAYETAFAATVPPSVIAANRNLLMSLLATDVLGQNMPAIAAAEAQYGEMWAQDAAAMHDYAASSAAATQMTPFIPPPQTTNAAGPATQAAAVSAATGASSGTSAQSTLSGIPDLVNRLDSLTGNSSISETYSSLFSIAAAVTKANTITEDAMSVLNLGMVEFKSLYNPAVSLPEIPKSALGAGLGRMSSPLAGGLMRAVSADVGNASLVGSLSVPPSWAAATPAIRLAANVLSGTSLAAAPAADVPGNLLRQMALGSLTGGAIGGAVPRVISETGIPRRATAGSQSDAPVKLDRVIAQLRQQTEAVQHWHVDEAGLDNLLAELSKKPGIHAVHLSGDDKTKPTPPKFRLG